MGSKAIIIFVIFTGIFTVLASAFNWDFFFNNRKARLFVGLLGRTGARIIYLIFGLLIIAFGVALLAGFVSFYP